MLYFSAPQQLRQPQQEEGRRPRVDPLTRKRDRERIDHFAAFVDGWDGGFFA